MDAIEKSGGVPLNWLPAFHIEAVHEVRPKQLVKEIDLVDYWNEFGWPDICHPLDNGDFVLDCKNDILIPDHNRISLQNLAGQRYINVKLGSWEKSSRGFCEAI